MDQKGIITVNKGTYFPLAVTIVGFILIFFALTILITFIYWEIGIKGPLYTVGPLEKATQILSIFLSHDFPIIVLLLLAAFFLIRTERFFSFNPETKQIREGGKFLKWSWGKWKDFQPNCKYVAFQRYEQTSNYSYGGFFEKTISEYIYDLRLIKEDKSFVSLISVSEFKSIAQTVVLGKKISEVYGIPFYDYVKELVKKHAI